MKHIGFVLAAIVLFIIIPFISRLLKRRKEARKRAEWLAKLELARGNYRHNQSSYQANMDLADALVQTNYEGNLDIYGEAVQLYENAITLRPNDVEPLLEMAIAIEFMIDGDESSDELYDEAHKTHHDMLYARAYELYKKALALNPTNAKLKDAWENLVFYRSCYLEEWEHEWGIVANETSETFILARQTYQEIDYPLSFEEFQKLLALCEKAIEEEPSSLAYDLLLDVLSDWWE